MSSLPTQRLPSPTTRTPLPPLGYELRIGSLLFVHRRRKRNGCDLSNTVTAVLTRSVVCYCLCFCFLVNSRKLHTYHCRSLSGFGGLGVACWPLVPKFAGSNPAFSGRKNPQHNFFRRGSKAPCRRFTACKRSLNVTWKSGISDKIYRPFLAHISSTFGC
jgi:hypothetical protein